MGMRKNFLHILLSWVIASAFAMLGMIYTYSEFTLNADISWLFGFEFILVYFVIGAVSTIFGVLAYGIAAVAIENVASIHFLPKLICLLVSAMLAVFLSRLLYNLAIV